ncbi:MAG: hypothetical protein JKY14_06995 [Paraglaciecola sp.]|nr:hypothetical protein [Paraglaciecola sp.]
MPIDSTQFFNLYAQALNTFNSQEVASFCLAPTVVMSDLTKKVMVSKDEVEQTFSRILKKLDQAGIKTFEPKLQQTMRLSGTLFFSKMRWYLYDQQQQLSFSFAASYTLQKMPDEQFKIIVLIIDDDENKLADIFTNTE